MSTGGNYEARFNLNIDSTSGNTATDRWINAYTDATDGTDKNFANTYLAPVSAGDHTFYFLAARYNGAGTVQLYDSSLSVLYFPSSSAEVLACGVSGNTGGATSVRATSSNTALVPNTNIVIGGSGDTRTTTITPRSGTYGTTTITIMASDGGFTVTESFTVTVTPFRLVLPLLRR